LIQADGNDEGDAYPQGQLRFLTADQLADPSLPGNPNGTSWNTIVPDDSTSPPTPPTDSHMIESIAPRPGLPGIDSGPDADPIHGHEWNIDVEGRRNDLQFSCIFDLPEERPCNDANAQSCDCSGEQALLDERRSPLCQQPGGGYTNTQVAAKAYPGTRHLQVLRDFGDQSIVASICARNVNDTNAQDFGYRPAVDAIVDRLKEALSNRCVGRQLAVTPVEGGGRPTASAPCSLVEVEVNPASCDCGALPARSVPDPEVRAAVLKRMPDVDGLCASDAECQQACLCQLDQVPPEGGALESCQYDIAPGGNVQGWCYVDPDAGYGNSALVAGCAATDRRILRFVPDQLLRSGTTTFVACFGASPNDDGRVIQVEQIENTEDM